MKRNWAAWALVPLVLFISFLQPPTDQPAPPTRTFLFVDQFNGKDLRPIWRIRGKEYELGSTYSRGNKRACSISGGVFHLRVIADPNRPGQYLQCHVGTEGRFEFDRGWAAARVKVQPFSGSHSAFWILTPTVEGDIAGHEVDVMEFFGSSKNVWHGVWYPNPEELPVGFPFIQEHKATRGDVSWAKDYHTYMVHWTPSRYSFWIDGERVDVIRLGLTGVPKFLILSILTRDWEVPNLLTHSLDSYNMKVDWIKVWTVSSNP